MEPENNQLVSEVTEETNQCKTVTPASKYVAMFLFIVLPFIGGWIGYTYAPETVVEVEKIVEVETLVESDAEVVLQSLYGRGYASLDDVRKLNINLQSGELRANNAILLTDTVYETDFQKDVVRRINQVEVTGDDGSNKLNHQVVVLDSAGKVVRSIYLKYDGTVMGSPRSWSPLTYIDTANNDYWHGGIDAGLYRLAYVSYLVDFLYEGEVNFALPNFSLVGCGVTEDNTLDCADRLNNEFRQVTIRDIVVDTEQYEVINITPVAGNG